ncbi:Nucleoside-diphosphate-sugar epimerase [Cyclonatronum proteinivorum]|uniref:Nucleoside-diphosphate-sugar epimerase n=1 Tax=Cyclonatronum proteinivorum TaxID=1457365 RepID=A0A345UNJ9_9BACT|nr:SDR family oxidoreductase [Cyclonatronum proteinivorum]AXJ02051.1 Nucleoside-diphosphate-sugar epimerase [Cyclonatronum proteinivorum]
MHQPPVKTVSVLGCGWYGLPLASRLVRAGFQVNGSTTSEEKRPLLQAQHVSDYVLEFTPGLKSAQSLHSFFDADVLVLNIPPGRRRENLRSWYRLLIDNLMPHLLASPISQVIFISSTSVYPDVNGVVQEEDAGAGSVSESGQAMLEAEAALLGRSEFGTTVLRFSGLYGNGRHPAKYLAGRTRLKKPEAPVNLVHLEDCIRVTERVIRRQVSGEVFSVCCDEHPNRKTYYTESARRMGLAVPEFDPPQETDSWKQVSSRKLRDSLGYAFRYKSPYDGY